MSIHIDHLTHTYRSAAADERPVLDIERWHIEPGEQILLRGVSGSGKTTLFNVMTGLLQPTQGQVWYDDLSLYSLSEAERDRFRARNIGYIFQNHFLLETMTAAENVEMPLAFARQSAPAQRQRRAQELLGQVGLAERLTYYPRQLSTGQRMRVAIARALANQPKVLFADEPTAALDETSSETAMNLIQATCRENNAILIVASHDPALTQRLSAIVDLQAGQIVPQAAKAQTREARQA